MTKIIYTPVQRRAYFLLSGMCILSVFLYELFVHAYAWPMVVLALCFFINAVTHCGYVILDEAGFYAISSHGKELVCIPWKAFHMCKVYSVGDITSVCVFFQNPSASIGKRRILDLDGTLRFNRYGRVLLCDLSLRRLVFGCITAERFAQSDILGCVVTDKEYRQILDWMDL